MISIYKMENINNINITPEWEKYMNDINNKINSMWSFFIYKDFCDTQVVNLKKQVKMLSEERDDALQLYYKTAKKEESPVNINRGTKRKNNLLLDEYKKVKKHKTFHVLKKIIDNDIFSSLNSIDDIINLKYHPNKYDYVNNNKFNKLYNIIPPLEELQNIIGMKNVKDKIFRSICYFLHDISIKNEMNHVMIMGPPGVGKTTIAHIMGKIYLSLGFLENDTFITATRSDLVAKYLGQTADKTQKVIDSALGGVLFIDEVYSLGNKEQRDSFAKECIDTINLNMSRTDRPWLLIVGGYKEEIENSFLAYNKGLERRFTIKLEINGYDETELYNILMNFINEEKWSVDIDAITIKDIKEHKDKFKYFGGDMRKLFQLAKENYCVRSMKTNITLNNLEMKLCKDDFNKAIEQFISLGLYKKEDLSHLMMYI
jgi:SpoVK/Ycf46/Vps4 family AAA+-type ATPase